MVKAGGVLRGLPDLVAHGYGRLRAGGERQATPGGHSQLGAVAGTHSRLSTPEAATQPGKQVLWRAFVKMQTIVWYKQLARSA